MSFLKELRKRNVYKVATAYLASSWLLIQVISSIGSSFSLTENLKVLIYKILFIGFPITLILDWLYELTPQGRKRTRDFQVERKGNQKKGAQLNKYIIAVLAILLVFVLVDRFLLTGDRKFAYQEKATLAVLPFNNISGNNKYDYVGEGLAIELRDFKRAQLVLAEEYPELKNSKSGTREFAQSDWDRTWAAHGYSDLQRLNGNKKLADYYARMACDFTYSVYANDENLFEFARCDAISGNDEAMFSKLKEIFLEGNMDVDLHMLNGIGFSIHATDPRFKSFISKVTKRIHDKRKEAITYLKQQGEWDSSWDKDLGLL